MRGLVLGVAVVLGVGCSSPTQVVQQAVAPEPAIMSQAVRPERPVPATAESSSATSSPTP